MDEVADRIHRLTRGVVNVYVVEDGGRFVLVDAGAPKDWGALVEGLADLGAAPTAIEAILLTHAHSDHTGFAERARAEIPTTVRVHTEDAEAARTGKTAKNEAGYTRYLLRLEAYRTLLSLGRRKALSIVPIAEVSTFADGEVLDLPGRPTIVHAPGHTSGMCAIAFPDRDVVATGDALVTHNALTGRRGPQIPPSALNRDSAQAFRSLAAIAALDVKTVLPGHGDPWTVGAAAAVAAAYAAGPS